MERNGGLPTYCIVLVVLAYLAGAVAYSARGISIAGCRVAPAGYFISLCGSPKFGDYEHDAFWFGLEPAALENLKAADVVFTGSSRTMFAFSTSEVQSYFAARGLRQFNLGFSGEDGQAFFARLAVRHQLHPRMLVIGVDPYFSRRLSPAASAAIYDWLEVGHLLVKQAQIAYRSTLCEWQMIDCSSVQYTAFRSASDGYFVWRDVLMPDAEHPRPHETRARDFQVNVRRDARTAKRFLSRIGISPDCVVLVPMPLPDIWPKPDPVKRIAEAIGAVYIDADTGDDLTLVDGMHLSYWSAKRFSAEFLRALDHMPQTCLGAAPP
ncbi:MAG: hypothetical protein WA418_22215 [Bradyrhizobium sp.]